jgi:hypothetical protein
VVTASKAVTAAIAATREMVNRSVAIMMDAART